MDIERQKNKATKISFPMLDTDNPETFLTGLTVADEGYYDDGAGYLSLAITDTVTEISSSGVYELSLTAAEMNHNLLSMKFTATGAPDNLVNIHTTSVASITPGTTPTAVVGNIYSSVPRVLQFNTQMDITRITSATIISYMQWADNQINSKLGVTYSVPFASGSVPLLVTNISTELTTIQWLASQFTEQDPSKNPWWKIRYDALFEQLDNLASGDEALVDDSGDDISITTGQIVSNVSGYTATFNLLDPEDQQVDPDRLDDELDALD